MGAPAATARPIEKAANRCRIVAASHAIAIAAVGSCSRAQVPLFGSKIHGYSAPPSEKSSFLKKRTKKLLHLMLRARPELGANRQKVFCFFFLKKKFFLS